MKKTVKLILLPIIYSVVTSIVMVFISFIYTGLNAYYLGYNTNEQLDLYFKSDLYKQGMSDFLNKNYIYISLLIFMIFVPFLYKKYKQLNLKEEKIKLESILIIMVLTFLVAGITNIIFFQINSVIGFTNAYNINYDTNIFILVLTSGIVGPIIEELIFRGLLYNGFKEEYTPMLSIIITSVLFSIFHTGIINIVYSFELSFLLIYVYEKYKTIKAPIIMHITSNIFVMLFVYILSLSSLVNYILLIIFIIGLLLMYFKVIKKDNKIMI